MSSSQAYSSTACCHVLLRYLSPLMIDNRVVAWILERNIAEMRLWQRLGLKQRTWCSLALIKIPHLSSS